MAFGKEKEEEIQVQEGKYGDKKVGVAGKRVEGTKISPGGRAVRSEGTGMG